MKDFAKTFPHFLLSFVILSSLGIFTLHQMLIVTRCVFVDESNTGYRCIFFQETWPASLQTNVLLSFNVLFIRLKHLYVSSQCWPGPEL